MKLVWSRSVEGQAYVRGIDGLRAVAVTAVVLYHLAPGLVPGGFLGVDVFFVISGYVVTGSLRRDAHPSLPALLAAFYARRFRRIVPALVACLLATVVASVAFIPDAWLSTSIRATGLAAFLGFGNFVLANAGDAYFGTRAEFNPFTHTWSLAVEEQFYLVFPLLLAAALSSAAKARRELGTALLWLAFAASLAWCAWASARAPEHAFYLLPARYWELAAGAAACLAGRRLRERLIAMSGARAASAAAAAAVLACLALAPRAGAPFPWTLAIVAATAVVICVLDAAPATAGPPRWLASAPMVALGILSYSIYLWHWPVYTLLRWTVGLEAPLEIAAALSITFVLATASYRFIESPFQRNAFLRRQPDWAVALAGVALAAGGWGLAGYMYAHQNRISQSTVEAHRLDWYPYARGLETTGSPGPSDARCRVAIERPSHVADPPATLVPTHCAAARAAPPFTLFVAGDSHAMAAERLLQFVASKTAVPVIVHARGDCPFADFMRTDARTTEGCKRFRRTTIEAILARARPGDVVWLSSLRMPRLSLQGVVPPASAGRDVGPARVSAEERRVAEAQASAMIDRLTGAGLRVLLSAPLPVFPAPAFQCSDAFNRSNPICRPGLEVSRGRLDEDRRAVVDAIARIAAARPGVRVWDPWPVLCPEETCRAFRGGRPLFFDGDHLSGYGNEVLLPSFLVLVDALRTDAGAATPH